MVRYNSLPPWRYVLQAQAFAPLADFGEVATVLTLQVAARTSWQTALGGIAAWCDDKVGLALPHADSSEGVVTMSVDGLSAIGGTSAELLRRADLALFVAKAAGRNCFMADDPAT